MTRYIKTMGSSIQKQIIFSFCSLLCIAVNLAVPTKALDCIFPNIIEAAQLADSIVKAKVIEKDEQNQVYTLQVLESWKSENDSKINLRYDMWSAYLQLDKIYLISLNRKNIYQEYSLDGCEDIVSSDEKRFSKVEEVLYQSYFAESASVSNSKNLQLLLLLGMPFIFIILLILIYHLLKRVL